jgi:response regulator RpfG family c-di-GMP phosphodiesterase
LQVITEQNASLDEHLERVSQLAGTLAVALGQPDHEVRRIRLAAKLHDVGKTAIPAAILAKPWKNSNATPAPSSMRRSSTRSVNR